MRYHLHRPRFDPVLITDATDDRTLFRTRPYLTPLLFPNVSSDARDHCANERNFLSWLRLSMYLCIVALAITLSFHMDGAAEPGRKRGLEMRMARPLGAVFWACSLVCLGTGCAGYVNTVRGYARRSAVVQSGRKTRVVYAGVAAVIVFTCVLFIVVQGLEA